MKNNLFIGIGAQKSATTWIFKVLSDHPDIFIPKEKEIHFFSDDENYNKGAKWYESKFENSTEKIVGDMSTSYLSSEKAVDRIIKHYSGAKIIVCLRNPVDRTVSHINHLISKNKLSYKDNLDFILHKYPEVIENSLYGKHLSGYFNKISRENFFVCFFDDIVKTPKKVVVDLYNFLGVDSKYVPNNINMKYNSSDIRLNKLHSIMNRFYFMLNKSKVGRILIGILKSLGFSSIQLLIFINKFSRKKKTFELNKKDLQPFFIEDIAILSDILQKHLESWKKV